MADKHFIVTINKKELQYVGCCDCGLVHEVSYDIYENSVDMHFVRDDKRTEEKRAEKLGSKSKLMCLLLDEAILRESLIPVS